MSNNKGEKMMMNFDNAYMTDEESFEARGEMLIEDYEKANKDVKKGMDNALINLCGYSFETLLNENIEHEPTF